MHRSSASTPALSLPTTLHLLCRRRPNLNAAQLLPPHPAPPSRCCSKKDAKLDTKSDRGVINEVADMKVGGLPSWEVWVIEGALTRRQA